VLYGRVMSKGRMEAFSDAVIAIIMTIMVLELRPPEGTDWSSLQPLIPVFLTYVLSFVYLGIYWNNHHHLLQATTHISGGILWANLNLLFWLSLFPFATGWMGENHAATVPTIAYGLVLLMAGVAYYVLQSVIVASEGPDSALAAALGRDLKGKSSPVIYLVAIVMALFNPVISLILYVAVAAMWLIPDRRIERRLHTA
jgi:TMEM175 potassium channel family protein